jgi:hypothetical protein
LEIYRKWRWSRKRKKKGKEEEAVQFISTD